MSVVLLCEPFFPRPLLIMNRQEIITEEKSPPGEYLL